MLKLYEIAGEEVAFRPSPYCWRIRMALAHKGLEFEPVPWRAVEKARIARSGGGTVPVLVDGDLWLRESWDIALYLDDAYPDRPRLLADDGARAKARYFDHWMTEIAHPLMAKAVLVDQFPLLDDRDKAYYLERTKRKFGISLEEFCADPAASVAALAPILSPLQETLAETNFLGGGTPDYADYIVFWGFQWVRVASRRRLYEPDSPLARWFERLLAAHQGFASAQPDRAHWAATPDGSQ